MRYERWGQPLAGRHLYQPVPSLLGRLAQSGVGWVPLRGERPRYQRSHFPPVADPAGGAQLHQQVADGRGLHRSGHDVDAGGGSDKAEEQLVGHATTDDVHDAHAVLGQVQGLLQRPGNGQGHAVHYAAHELGVIVGHWLAVAGTGRTHQGGHVAGPGKFSAPGVDQRTEGGLASRLFQQVPDVARVTRKRPGALALLEHPMAHDVAEKAHGAVHA